MFFDSLDQINVLGKSNSTQSGVFFKYLGSRTTVIPKLGRRDLSTQILKDVMVVRGTFQRGH